MAATFDEAARVLLDGKNFAIVATLNADGSPHTSVVWFKRDGDSLVFSTKASRIKARNIAGDPRVSVSIFDLTNPYSSLDIRGTAQVSVDEDKALPQELSMKYLGQDPPPEPDEDVRLMVRVSPDKISRFSA